MQNVYYVYILIDTETEMHHYVGFTQNLSERLAKHNAGEVPHTSKFKPWKVETAIAFSSKEKAYAFEAYLKTHSGRSPTDTFDLCPKAFSAVANICKRWYIITEGNQ